MQRNAKLETDLIQTEDARRKLVDLVGQLAREANGVQAAASAAAAPPPEQPDIEDVRARIALIQRLNHAIRVYGRAQLRVHDVSAVEGGEIASLRLLSLDGDGVPIGLYRAAKARIEVDRSTQVATIVMQDVVETIGGVDRPQLAEQRLRFELESPRAFIAELEPLVHLTGVWPETVVEAPKPIESLIERGLWRERFESFLEGIVGEQRFRLQSVGAIDMPRLHDVELVVCNEHGIWQRRIQAKRLEVFVDDASGRVEFLLRDGFIESTLGKIDLPRDRDYRMHVAGAAPTLVKRTLMGMVRSKDG